MNTAPNPSVAMARVIVDELTSHQVNQMVIAPGSRSGALAMAAAADSRVDLSVAIDERSAGFWAVGFGKATGRPAAVVTTSGTAVGNLFPAVIEADASDTPLLLLTADRPASARASGANQTIDQVKLFGERVRFFSDVPIAADLPGEVEWWRSLVSQALAAAASGPVHLNLAFAEPLVPASDDGRSRARPYTGVLSPRTSGLPFTKSVRTLPPATSFPLDRRTLVVAGPGADLELVSEAISAGWPVVAEGHSGARIPGTISTAHHLLASAEIADLLRPDRIVVLGRAGLSRHLLDLFASTNTHWANDRWFDPNRSGQSTGSIGEWQIGEIDVGWRDRWNKAEGLARTTLDSALDSADFTEPRLARDVSALVPPGGTLVVGSSMPVRDVDWFARPRSGLKVISNRGASGIDGLVSVAHGAAVGSRASTVALLGDLTLLHDGNGLLTEPRTPVVMVVVNNAGGGIFSFLPQADFPEHFEQVFGTPRLVDWALWAEALGVGYHRLESADRLAEIIAAGLAQSLPLLVEARTDRVENVAIHRQLSAAAQESAIQGLRASPEA